MTILTEINSGQTAVQKTASEEESFDLIARLPNSIKENIFTYCEEITPTDLLGRVEYHPSLNATHRQMCFFLDWRSYAEHNVRLSGLAKELGIPLSFVDERFEAAYEEAEKTAQAGCIRLEVPVQQANPSPTDSGRGIQTQVVDEWPYHYFYNTQHLLRAAENFYATATLPAPLDFSTIPDNLSAEELLTQLLKQYNGLLIGEIHEESVARLFIIKYLPLLVKLGVDTLFIEGMREENWGRVFMQYFMGRAEIDWEGNPDGDVFIQFKKAGGKRIICLDTDASLALPSWRAHKSTARIMGGNYQFKRVIEKMAGAGKWIGFCGATHNGKAHGIAGLGQLLQIPAIWPVDVTKIPPLNQSGEVVIRQFKHCAEQRSSEADFAILMSPRL